MFRSGGGGLQRGMSPIWQVAFLVFLALCNVSTVPTVVGGGSHIPGHRNLIERRLENLKISLAAAPASSPGSSPKVSLSLSLSLCMCFSLCIGSVQAQHFAI
jgi:hypothetical protein